MKTREAPTAVPDLRLGGLSLWIHDRETPESMDYWGANWFVATAAMEASGAYVEVHGPFLHGSEIASFAKDLQTMDRTLTGEAQLGGIETELKALLTMTRLGHLHVTVEITPDQFTQRHRFEMELDQTHLPALLAGCRALMERFPLIGSPEVQEN